ncbi:S8 family serine peptidase [Acrocarpospora sp. B8E8]|uniref:S8 family serine peptidase n=1 Tax=Acrocarpospora sp. B8E8 TaxID=3153572 RepID=UPI00325D1644
MAAEISRIARRATESFHVDQIVVDLKVQGLVRQELLGLGITLPVQEHNDALGLTRFELDGLDQAMASLQTRADLKERMEKAGGKTYAGVAITPLDELLFHLREEFAGKHFGWYPAMAKNRMCESIEAAPYHGGSFGHPKRAPAFRLPPQTPQRDRRIRIGVFDTRLFPHPGLDGRYVSAPDVLIEQEEGKLLPSFAGHCLLICSIAAERAPEAEFVIKPVLDERTLLTTTWEVAKAMVESLKDDLDIFVLALGGTSADGQEPLVLQRACERTAGVVKVAALGNHADLPESSPRKPPAGTPMWPAASSTVIAVGADDATGDDAPAHEAFFSPRLDQAVWADVMAPGVDRRGLFLPGDVQLVTVDDAQGRMVDVPKTENFGEGGEGYATWSGSSFATAYVAGYLAGQGGSGGSAVAEEANKLFSSARVISSPQDVRVVRR